MLQINSLSKSFQDQVLMVEASFSISKGEKVGLVGRNGSGKSTLLKMILGEISADEGEIITPNKYILSSISQHISFSKETVLDECMSILDDDLKNETYRAEKLLSGLGFNQDDFYKNPLSFSGGFQIRINLVKALLKEPNLLLLDEPTNYLDITSIDWLKSFLRNFKNELILITHDRGFMDSVCNTIIGINNFKIKKVRGNTLMYYSMIQEEEEILRKTHANLQAKKDHLEAFIRRFKAKASKATQAQSKQKQLDKLEEIEILEGNQSMNLSFEYEELKAQQYLKCDNLSFGYSDKPNIIKDLSFVVNRGDKIGIVGANGKGKSTLLNLLAKKLIPQNGSVVYHDNLKIGFFGQTNIERLNSDLSIYDEVSMANTDLPQDKTRAICGAMMFSSDQAAKKISVLSGGEKSRVMLAKVMAQKSNFLFLDEPTNHLDMESIDILKKKLIEYPGSLLLVTHSKEFLKDIINKIIYFKNDNAYFFDGSFDEFENKIGLSDDENKSEIKSSNKLTKKDIFNARQKIVKDRAVELKPLEKEYNSLMNILEKLEEKEEQLNKKLEDAHEESDQFVLEASKEIGEIHKQIESNLEKVSSVENEIIKVKDKYQVEIDKLE
jgi:ATP-binding cassette subfamily F protein 3